MRDPRYRKLAQLLINHSVGLQPGEKVMIAAADGESELTRELIRAAYEAGGLPFLKPRDLKLQRELMLGATREQLEMMAAFDQAQLDAIDAYIGIAKYDNITQLNGVPKERHKLWMQHYASVAKTPPLDKKWCCLRFPSDAMAQLAHMATEDLEDFFFDVCTMDYAKMSTAIKPLAELMRRTDRVRIVGPGTELSFSIQDMPIIESDGRHNVPDGEVFTAPVRDSVNGVLTVNTPSYYGGFLYDNIRLTFRDGKIVEAMANDTARINKLLDTDDGARYIGEFAIAFHPYILEPMRDILFDEKIAGSFHFTPGFAYSVASNGNRSAIHWDLVTIQRPEYGGGEIWFDDVLIRRDGLFVLPALEGLNPEHLIENICLK